MPHRSVLFWTCWGSMPTMTKLSAMPSEAGSVVPLGPDGVDAANDCACAALADHVSSWVDARGGGGEGSASAESCSEIRSAWACVLDMRMGMAPATDMGCRGNAP